MDPSNRLSFKFQATSNEGHTRRAPTSRKPLVKNIHMKLSVAMITYNHERFIGQAIESILTQRLNFEYEIVIGEDCSTDGTRAIILEFQRRYPDRITVIFRERNIGALRNLAETLAACRGDYLAILEGDDYWSCIDKLQRQVGFLDAHPGWAICCARAEVRNERNSGLSAGRVQTGQIFPMRPGSRRREEEDFSGLLPPEPVAAGTYTLENLLRGNFIPTCTVVYRWDRLPLLPAWFFRFQLGDLPLHAMVVGQRKIELLDECMAVYRIHPGGIWSSRDRDSQLEANTDMLAALNRHLGHPFNNLLGVQVARSYLSLSFSARKEGKRLATARHVFACVRNGGWRISDSRRALASLALYVLLGSWYKVFSRKRAATRG